MRRRDLYRWLTKAYGNPVDFDQRQRESLLEDFVGWIGQGRGKAKNFSGWSLPHPRSHDKPRKDKLAEQGWIDQRLDASRGAFRYSGYNSLGHWGISATVYMPEWHNYVHDSHGMSVAANWETIFEQSKKQLRIVISPRYDKVVKAMSRPDGQRFYSKKLVQTVWDHRDYDGMEVWQCRYWDFTCLGNDEHSWKRATHHTGYLVKTAMAIAIEVDFERAINAARRKTVKQAVDSILDQYGEEQAG